MAKTEARRKAKEPAQDTPQAEGVKDAPSASPLERMADLTRRIIQVPRDEALKAKRHK
jgi:hypothetical protein